MTTDAEHDDEAERLAIIIEAGDVHLGRAKAIAACEARWRRGVDCTCMAHTTEDAP